MYRSQQDLFLIAMNIRYTDARIIDKRKTCTEENKMENYMFYKKKNLQDRKNVMYDTLWICKIFIKNHELLILTILLITAFNNFFVIR